MCIRDSASGELEAEPPLVETPQDVTYTLSEPTGWLGCTEAVSYTHLRAHETVLDLVCRLLLEKKKQTKRQFTCHE